MLHASTLTWSTNSNTIHELSHDPRTHRRHVHLRGDHRITCIKCVLQFRTVTKFLKSQLHSPFLLFYRNLFSTPNSVESRLLKKFNQCCSLALVKFRQKSALWSFSIVNSVESRLWRISNFSEVSSVVYFYSKFYRKLTLENVYLCPRSVIFAWNMGLGLSQRGMCHVTNRNMSGCEDMYKTASCCA